jgi:hypothetical protein
VLHRMAALMADNELEMNVRGSGRCLIPGTILVLFLVKRRNGTETSETTPSGFESGTVRVRSSEAIFLPF